MADKPAKLKIANREFASRLLVGTGKFASNELMRDALIASGTELVTVALRRADLSGKHDPFANILDFIDPKRFLLLPNTSGARNAEEAVRLARLAASAGLPTWIKLEIHPDPRYLLPDPVETLAAAEILVKEGFTVLPYINADPVLAKRLQDIGTATVMPLGSPIGSNRGIETRAQIEIIIEQATVPVVVDAGLGAPSHAAEAMEMGADAVLVNTAIAIASDPIRMAKAFKKAIEAGREAREIGLADKLNAASATSPLTGFLSRVMFAEQCCQWRCALRLRTIWQSPLSGCPTAQCAYRTRYSVVSLTSGSRCRTPRFVSFCNRFRRLDNAAFAAEFIRSMNKIPWR